MADNLTVQITADTSRLRADLKLAQVEVQRLNKEMTAAARQAAATGDRSQLDRLSREADNAAKAYANLNRQLKTANETVGKTTMWSAATKAVGGLKEELISLGRSAAAGFGLKELGELVGKTADEILRLRRLSQATGFDPTAIKALNETLEETGAEAGSGDRALIKLSEAYSKLRQDARAAGDSVGEGVRVFRGGSKAAAEAAQEARRASELASGVDVRRGGQPAMQTVKDAREALAALGVDWRKFANTMQGRTDFLQAIIDGFARLGKQGKTDLMNLAAFELFGAKNAKELGAAIKALGTEVGGLQAKMQELRDQGRDPNEDAVKRALEYRKALKDIGDAWDTLGFTLLQNLGPGLQEVFKGITNDINAINQASIDLAKLWNDFVAPTMQAAWDAFVADLKQFGTIDWAGLWSGFTSAAQTAIDTVSGWLTSLYDRITSAAGAVSSAFSASASVTGSAAGPGGFAAGGMIRGRGTGTSDSILARLSNGEFVINAAATSRFLPLLRAINDGMSMPLMPRTRFADGGLAIAGGSGGGTPVHLHLGGHSFALSGNSSVVSALVVEANRHKMRATGIKPSWYGGTPGR